MGLKRGVMGVTDEEIQCSENEVSEEYVWRNTYGSSEEGELVL